MDKNISKKVFIVYHYVAHYREPVFSKLIEYGKKCGIDYIILADPVANVSSIKTVDCNIFKEATGAKWIELRNIWFFKRFLWQIGLISSIINERPKAIIFLGNIYYLSTWVALLVTRLTNVRTMMWTHGFRRREKGLIAFLRTFFYTSSEMILLYGERALKLLKDRGVSESRMRIVFNSLDYDKQLAVREVLSGLDIQETKREMVGNINSFILIWSGRLIREKNLDFLLEAMPVLLESITNLKMIIVGDGPDRGRLEAKATHLGIFENIVFWGACYDEVILGKLFYISDLSVHSGPVGLAVIHSFAYGTPVLINDDFNKHGPEADAVVIGKTGDVYKTGSIESLIEKILSFKNMTDTEKIRNNCFHVIDTMYNPYMQAKIITQAVNDVIEMKKQL